MSKSESSGKEGVAPQGIPEALIEYDRWVCWRYEQVDGKEKKPPYDPKTGKKANITNSETWADFDTALDRYRKGNYDGIGFVLIDEGPFTGVDFDYCRDPESGTIQQETKEIIDYLNTYSEVSPSGTGTHSIVLGEKPSGFKNTERIEVYESARYFTVTGKHLAETPKTIEPRSEELRSVCEKHLKETSSPERREFAGIPEGDECVEEIQEAKKSIRDFFHATETGPRPPNYLTDLLKGRYAERGFKQDRSGAETTLCTLLYGTFVDGGAEAEEARKLTYHYITHAAKKNPYTKENGTLRKWLEGPPDQQRKYRRLTLDYAVRNFDPRIWDLWRQSGKRTHTNDYCEHAYEVALDALYNLTIEYTLSNPPHLSTNNTPDTCGYRESENPYPTMGEIVELAQEEYDLDETSFREILRRIRRDGGAKMARLGSSTYVYYPATFPDPPEACYVRVGGEKREPVPEPSNESSEEIVATDGGTVESQNESHAEIDRIKRAKSGQQSASDSPEVYSCPICGATVFGTGPLRSHVLNSNDAQHRHVRLDEDLNPVTLWEKVDWSPGAPCAKD